MSIETLRPRRRRETATSDPATETLSRVRRIETRMTQLMIGLGVDTKSQKPEFVVDGARARIQLPSPHSSMKEILDNIPETWEGAVGVFIGSDKVAVIKRPGT